MYTAKLLELHVLIHSNYVLVGHSQVLIAWSFLEFIGPQFGLGFFIHCGVNISQTDQISYVGSWFLYKL